MAYIASVYLPLSTYVGLVPPGRGTFPIWVIYAVPNFLGLSVESTSNGRTGYIHNEKKLQRATCSPDSATSSPAPFEESRRGLM
jgi:hypothetical protein